MGFSNWNKNNILGIPFRIQVAPKSLGGLGGLKEVFFMSFKDKVCLYLMNRSDLADDDFLTHLQHYRFHKCDEVDLLELIIKKVRKDVYNEVFRDVMNLTKLR